MITARTLADALIALAAALLAAGCASAPLRSAAPVGAILEVENRTEEPQRIEIRGRDEGLVPPGARLRVRHLTPGSAEVRAIPRLGHAQVTEVSLTEGGQVLWSLLPGPDEGPPLPPVPELASLEIVNPSGNSWLISVNNTPLGRLLPGETRAFLDLVPGTYPFTARADDGTPPADATHTLAPGRTTAWTLAPSGTILTVFNQTAEAVTLSVDGTARGRVAPAAQWRGSISLGSHLLTARAEPSRRSFEALVTVTATTDADATWVIAPTASSVTVVNQTPEPLSITSSTPGPPPLVPAHDTLTLPDLPTGPLTLTATGVNTRTPYTTTLQLVAGQAVTWIVTPATPTVRVENRTSEALALSLNPHRSLGVLPPGATTLLRDLPRATVQLRALPTDPNATATFETTFDLLARPAATWVLAPQTASLTIANARTETVAVYVDSRWVGDAPPSPQPIVFTGISPGARRIECVGRDSDLTFRTDVLLDPAASTLVTVPDPMATLDIANHTVEPLSLLGVLASDSAPLPPGTSRRVRVPAGRTQLVARGQHTGATFSADRTLTSGASATWEIVAAPAHLIVTSDLDEEAALSLDDRALRTLTPGATATLTDVPPGRHLVQAVGLKSGVIVTEHLSTRSGHTSSVRLAVAAPTLIISNESDETARVFIDALVHGEVAPRQTKGFARLASGLHTVIVELLPSGQRQETRLSVRPAERVVVRVAPPTAQLTIDNQSGEPTRIFVDGNFHSVVPTGATTLGVSAGKRLVEFERTEHPGRSGMMVDLRGGEAVLIPVPPLFARLVALNKTALPLTLRIDDHPLGDIAPGATRTLELPPTQGAWLRATDRAGDVTHEERRALIAGETATWVLDAAAAQPKASENDAPK